MLIDGPRSVPGNTDTAVLKTSDVTWGDIMLLLVMLLTLTMLFS